MLVWLYVFLKQVSLIVLNLHEKCTEEMVRYVWGIVWSSFTPLPHVFKAEAFVKDIDIVKCELGHAGIHF